MNDPKHQKQVDELTEQAIDDWQERNHQQEIVVEDEELDQDNEKED